MSEPAEEAAYELRERRRQDRQEQVLEARIAAAADALALPGLEPGAETLLPDAPADTKPTNQQLE